MITNWTDLYRELKIWHQKGVPWPSAVKCMSKYHLVSFRWYIDMSEWTGIRNDTRRYGYHWYGNAMYKTCYIPPQSGGSSERGPFLAALLGVCRRGYLKKGQIPSQEDEAKIHLIRAWWGGEEEHHGYP